MYGYENAEIGVCVDMNPNSKVHGDNMGPIWGWQDQGGLHVGPMNFSIREYAVLPEWTFPLYR